MAENTVDRPNVPKVTEGQRLPQTRESYRYLSPAVDIYETDDGLVVVADIPGVDKDNLHIEVEDSVLTIHGKIALSPRTNLVSREYELLEYYRQFTLGDKVEQSKITANLKDGVLTLTLPKAEHAKPKQIQVKVS
jgi:HSP20 family molecular chaperone IbpA